MKYACEWERENGGWKERARKHDKCRCLLLPHTAHRWLYTRRTEHFKAEFFFHSIQNLNLHSVIVYSVYRFIDLINKIDKCRIVCVYTQTEAPSNFDLPLFQWQSQCVWDSELLHQNFERGETRRVKTMKRTTENWISSSHWDGSLGFDCFSLHNKKSIVLAKITKKRYSFFWVK